MVVNIQVPVLSRDDVVNLHNNNVLYTYDKLVAAYNRYLEDNGFYKQVRNWYVGIVRQLLSLCQRARRIDKIKMITVMYKLNITYRIIFEHIGRSGYYKAMVIRKAQEFMEEGVPDELKNVLEHFLAIMH